MIDLSETDVGFLVAFAVRYCIPRKTIANREIARIVWQLYLDGVVPDQLMERIVVEMESETDLDLHLRQLVTKWKERES